MTSCYGKTVIKCVVSDRCSGTYSGRDESEVASFSQVQSLQDEFPWLAQDNDEQSLEDDWHAQSRVRRSANESSGSKSVWKKIEVKLTLVFAYYKA